MAKHSEGPWEAWLGDAKFGITGETAVASLDVRAALRGSTEDGKVFAVQIASKQMDAPAIAFGKTREECEANARLIAASPDMYVYIKRQAESGDPVAGQLLEDVRGCRPS